MNKKIALVFSVLLLTAVLLLTGCGGTPVAQAGDTVKVHYTGTLADGTQFDSSVGKEPLEFVIGEGKVIAGFDKAVTGMKVGETKTVTIPTAEAYGPYREDLVFEMDRSKMPPDTTPEVGMQLQMTLKDGSIVPVTIKAITDTKLTLDANHPMAGKDLTFKLELVKLTKKK